MANSFDIQAFGRELILPYSCLVNQKGQNLVAEIPRAPPRGGGKPEKEKKSVKQQKEESKIAFGYINSCKHFIIYPIQEK